MLQNPTRPNEDPMRTIPVDTTALRLLATGEVQPVQVWAELSDGSRRPVPDAQEKDAHGTPLWTVGVLAPPVEEGDRAELLSVRVATYDRPQVSEFSPIRFDGLQVRVGVNRKTGALSQYWAAAGVVLPAAAKG
jgi:hypothetical protein